MGSYKEIEISRSEAKNYATVNDYGDRVTAKVYVGDDGKISEDSWSNEKKASMRAKNNDTASKKNDTSSSDKKSPNEKKAWYNTYCAKFLFTITLILPVWWIVKLPFVVGWGFLKSIYYIVSWPFRLLMCCCCNTTLIPEGTMKLPKYEF